MMEVVILRYVKSSQYWLAICTNSLQPMEKPMELLDDVEAFIETWKRVSFTM